MDSNFKSDGSSQQAIQAAAVPAITIVPRTVKLAGGTVNFSALVWSPLTAGLKSQLKYDNTGAPTDCSVPTASSECTAPSELSCCILPSSAARLLKWAVFTREPPRQKFSTCACGCESRSIN